MIDFIYIIISKEKEKERYNYIINNITKYLPNYFKNNKIIFYEPFFIDRDEIKLSSLNLNFSKTLKNGEKMLLATYVNLFKELLEKKYEKILILESDVLFVDNFEEKLNIIYDEWNLFKKNSSIVFLGNGCNLKPKTKRISNNLYLENRSKCTDSMLLDLESITNINIFLNSLEIIDLPIDHLLNRIMNKTIYGYWIHEPIIFQGSQNGTYKSCIRK
jgi:hypothetical protein